MNDWLPSQSGLRHHPKTRRLARVLDIPIPHVIGYLHCLWYWALEYAPDVDLEDFDLEDVADAAGWAGDAETFVEALVTCGSKGRPGFLERGGDGRLCIHDWEDNQGDRFRARIQAAAKKRAQRAQAGGSSSPVPITEDNVPETGDSVPRSRDLARAKDQTRPDQTNRGSSPAEPAHPSGGTEAQVELFHELCPSLPRVRQITETRRRRLRALPGHLGGVEVADYFRRVEASDFLTGRSPGGRRWRADLDWILKPEHIPRVLEGCYDGPPVPQPPYHSPPELPEDDGTEVPMPDYVRDAVRRLTAGTTL